MARLVFRRRRSEYITDAPVSLHWLQVAEKIIFKIAMQNYWVLHGDASYDSSHQSLTSRLDKDCGLVNLMINSFLL